MAPGLLDDPARAAAARRAVEEVESGMTIGLGSGRAVWAVVELLAQRFAGGSPLRAAVASSATEAVARRAGMEVVELDGALRLDVAIDGADEIDPALRLIKGGGAALLREKLVATAARRFVIVAEANKRVPHLGTILPLPVEVVRFGWRDTRRRLLDILPEATLRQDQAGPPLVTDEGHFILDCRLPALDAETLADKLKATVGVVEHGLFLNMASEVILGHPDGRVEVVHANG